MFRLLSINSSPYGDAEVYSFECTECGNVERVSSTYAKNGMKVCSKCGEPVEDVTNIGVGIVPDVDRKRILALLRRISLKCQKDRTIKMCSEWRDPDKFVEWCIKNGYKNWNRMYRYNDNGDFEPDNCYWAPHKKKKTELSEEDIEELNKELKSVELDVTTVAKNLESLSVAKSDIDKVVKVIKENTTKEKVAQKLLLKMEKACNLMKEVIIMQEAYNYMAGEQVFNSDKTTDIVNAINKVRRDIE